MPQRRNPWEIPDEEMAGIHYMLAGPHRSGYDAKWESGYVIEDYLELPSYELGEGMKIHDVVWGECKIGNEPYDQLLMRLARTPLFRRLQSVEQLTLGPDHSTVPNTAMFSRWQHIWGSLVFVRKMTEGDERFNERDRIVMQLRTLFSDVGQTSFSHLGDWLFQGVQGGEDLHDEDLRALLRVNGIEELLAEYDLTIEETVFPIVKDWVECPSPALCVDRVDYGLREILRWGKPSIPMMFMKNKLSNPRSLFEIDEDKQLVIQDMEFARYFAAGFSILPTEHWAHPVHRVQLELLQSVVRSALVDELATDLAHPRELMYGIDSDFTPFFHTWDGLFIDRTMKDIGQWQRQIFVEARRRDLDEVFRGINNPSWTFPNFPDPLMPYSWQTRHYTLPIPPTMSMELVDEHKQEMAATPYGLEIHLPSLKARAVDPPVRIGDTVVPLSVWEPSYKRYLEGQYAVMRRAYRATIHMRPDIAEGIVAQHRKTLSQWPELLRRPRDDARLRQKIKDTMPYAAARCFDMISEV
ncbi:MAG: hypothetical protein WAU02_03670 [Candidatus Saccharimonadales bacterium]